MTREEHYTDGRRWSHISKAWILLSSWNDREELATMTAAAESVRLENVRQRALIEQQGKDIDRQAGLVSYLECRIEALRGFLVSKISTCEQQAKEIDRLKQELAGWKELEGKDIYQQYTNCRAKVKALQAQLATAKGIFRDIIESYEVADHLGDVDIDEARTFLCTEPKEPA